MGDGGASSTQPTAARPGNPSGRGIRNLLCGRFTDANHGTVVGNSGKILHTTDGGSRLDSAIEQHDGRSLGHHVHGRQHRNDRG